MGTKVSVRLDTRIQQKSENLHRQTDTNKKIKMEKV